MLYPDFVPIDDVNFVYQYDGVDENLALAIFSIGWQETHWGRLGAGKSGWILGCGYYPGSKIKKQTRYLEGQLKCFMTLYKRWGKTFNSEADFYDFSAKIWKNASPEGWSKNVYAVYSKLIELKKVTEATPVNYLPYPVSGYVYMKEDMFKSIDNISKQLFSLTNELQNTIRHI